MTHFEKITKAASRMGVQIPKQIINMSDEDCRLGLVMLLQLLSTCRPVLYMALTRLAKCREMARIQCKLFSMMFDDDLKEEELFKEANQKRTIDEIFSELGLL